MRPCHFQLIVFSTLLLSSLPSSKGQSPTIDIQPQSQSVVVGSNVVFSVSASGAEVVELPQVDSGTLQLWLRADQGLVTSGDYVSEWQDQSGNANHAFQTDAEKQPIFADGAVPFSGKPAVRFDGSFDTSSGPFLQGSGNVGIPDAYTSFMVYSMSYAGDGERMPAFVGVPGAYGHSRGYYVLNGEMSFTSWTYDFYSGFIIPTNTYRIWTDRMDTNQTTLEFFDCTAASATNFSVSIYGQQPPEDGYYVGGLNALETAGRKFAGDVAELIYYRGFLNETDRVAVENYLKEKYYHASVPGGGTLTYQWKFNGTNLDGATTTSFAITNVQPQNSGIYSVIVSNNFGGTETDGAVLTVNIPPSITAQPQDLTIFPSTNARFSVTAAGTLPLNYQWFFNGAIIPNATDSSYTITSAQPADAGNYSVLVTNVAGSILSDGALLTIPVLPTIFSQPEGQTVMAGTNISLLVGAETVLPNVLSGTLRLWLKADQGVLVENGYVKEWQDQSTNENHAFQSNPDKQPLFVGSVSSISGKPTVRFDGIQNVNTGDWLRGTNNLNIPTGYTSFLVYSRANRSIAEQASVVIGIPGQANTLRSYFIRDDGEMAFSAWSNDYGTDYNIPADNYRIWTDRLNNTKTLLEFFDVTSTNTLSFTRNTSGLGTPGIGYYLGGLDTQLRNFQGDISELIVYQNALTDADRLAVQDYLKAKYYLGLGQNALSYQWRVNGTNLPNATNAFLALTNVLPSQSGNYSVVLTNLAGSITSSPALVRIRYIFPEANGERLTNSQYHYTNSASVSFQKYFINGMVFYTLDGSTPSFSSQSYSGPFVLTNNAIIRAIIYSIDFTQSGESDPVDISIVPTYTLSKITSGGGSIVIDGINPFMSNTIVNVTAIPSSGWTFLEWLDDASGTSTNMTVTMTRNKSVRAVFGTTLNTTAANGGTNFVKPAAPLYSHGSVVEITAVPNPGNYFGIWGNAASGNTNPLYFPILTANPTVSSLFTTLGGGQFALSVRANGSGRVSLNPRANVYSSGQIVALTATPDAGQAFLGWTGDAGGTANPLNVTMNQSRYITAHFTKDARLSAQFSTTALATEGLPLNLSCDLGEIFLLQESTNLVDWQTAAVKTNLSGSIQFLAAPQTNAPQQYYRAKQP